MKLGPDDRFKLLTDRWGDDANFDVTTEEAEAVKRLLPAMWDDVTFVARDTSTGEIGLLVNYEYCTVGDAKPDEVRQAWGKDVTFEDQVKYVEEKSDELQRDFPQSIVVPFHGQIGRLEIDAFLPEAVAASDVAERIWRSIEGTLDATPAP